MNQIVRAAIAISALLFLLPPMRAQDTGTPLPQGSSIPGLGGAPLGLNGPGYIETGGGYSDMYPLPYTPWKDGYLHIVASSARNTGDGEISRQDRYGASGWYYNAGLTRVLSENLFGDVQVGSSSGGFFLPRLRIDSNINLKVLPARQLVLNGGFGYDKSKQVNRDYRYWTGVAYYAPWSLIGQAGVNFTRAQPGNLLDMTEYLAVTQGHDKEHYLTIRAETGREGYEVVGPTTALENFDFRHYSGTWRQWIGVGWGVNLVFDHEDTPFYRRNGGTTGIFFEF